MLNIQEQIERIRNTFQNSDTPVLSIYADVNPAKPENSGKAWVIRIKNTLKEIPEIKNSKLYEPIIKLIEQDRPEAKTMALFATIDKKGNLLLERIDLQVELPVVDVAHGKIDARYGEPYLTPLLFAADEYEPAGVLHLSGVKWRFYEIFLGEIKEDLEIFKEISPENWKEIKKISSKIGDIMAIRKAKGGSFNKLSPKERKSAKISVWLNKMYKKLALATEKTISRLKIQRLILMGESWQVSHFEGYLNRSIRNKIIARLPHPTNPDNPSIKEILEKANEVLEKAEREFEIKLLDKIKKNGIWGFDAVLDALQMGRVEVFVLPWNLDAKIWRCPEEGFVAGKKETAKIFCNNPIEVPLRDYVWALAEEYGARLEFVRGEAEKIILKEFNGTAAIVRW